MKIYLLYFINIKLYKHEYNINFINKIIYACVNKFKKD